MVEEKKDIFDLTIYISEQVFFRSLNLPYMVEIISLKRRQPLLLLGLKAILYTCW